jgi:hypothetical protein
METITDFLFLDSNIIFLISGLVLTGLVTVEILFMFFGSSMGQMLGLDAPSVDDAGDAGGFSPLKWANQGSIPFVVFAAALLAVFSIVGFIIQWIPYRVIGSPLHGLLAAPLALIPTLLIVRWITVVISRAVPREFSTAIFTDSLSGQVGEVTIKTSPFKPGQAKVKDQWGTTHYVRILPQGDEEIEQGSDVVLIDQENHVFSARKI